MVADCVHCGWCCKKAPCPFGEKTREDDPSCEFLDPQGDGTYRCSRYDFIQRQPGASLCPAFGAGCSSTIGNVARRAIIERMRFEERMHESV